MKKRETENLIKEFPAIINSLKKHSILFGTASTRGYLRTLDVMGDLSTLPHIVLNGAEVYDHSGKSVMSFSLETTEKTDLFHFLQYHRQNIKLLAYYPLGTHFGRIFVENKQKAQAVYEKYAATFQKPTDITVNLSKFFKRFCDEDVGILEIHLHTSSIQFPSSLNISTDGHYYLTAKNINKGTTLSKICHKLHIEMSNLLVAGDSLTDQYMFDLPDVTSVAVGNGNLQANYHVESPEVFAVFLRRTLLTNEDQKQF